MFRYCLLQFHIKSFNIDFIVILMLLMLFSYNMDVVPDNRKAVDCHAKFAYRRSLKTSKTRDAIPSSFPLKQAADTGL